MAIRIDENTIFEDGRMKKISEVNAEPRWKLRPRKSLRRRPQRKSLRLRQDASPRLLSKERRHKHEQEENQGNRYPQSGYRFR